ncbi:MAG: hypothetical protein LBU86_07485 [Oscillospiraceae bacterium]|jgi:hypothetical protein|nr:hypothetical protein [Oscillospiraceae bacterium]
MIRSLSALLLALILALGPAEGALGEYKSPDQIAREAAEKAAAMQEEARAEIEARAESKALAEEPGDAGDEAPPGISFEKPRETEAQIDARSKELEKKYGLAIKRDNGGSGESCVGTAALDALDLALESVTPAFVRQVSGYWQKRAGKRLSFSFTYSPKGATALGLGVTGFFDVENAVIEIYLPDYSRGASLGGESPLNCLHEFGHAVQYMLMELHGEAALEREWGKLNGEKAAYTFGEYPEHYDETVWISAYASTRYEEDFAEVFAHAFLRHREGMGFASRLTDGEGKYTVLGKKAAYIEKLLKLYAGNPGEVIGNMRRLYLAFESREYKGLTVSGDYLQFGGCPAPRYLLAGLLSSMKLTPDIGAWVNDIGGWEVTTGEGKRFLIFPGGKYFAL